MNAAELIERALRIAPYIALLSLRVAVVFSMMPAPFGELAPGRIRAVLGFLVALVVGFPTLGSAGEISTEPLPLLVAGITELVVGAVIGLTVRVTLAAAEAAGTLAGHAMGLGFANQIDPLFGGEAIPTSTIIGSLAVLIFFALGGHHTVLEALSASVVLAPPGGAFPTLAPGALAELGSKIVAQGLRIAAPVVATMFLVQLGTALVARSAPRVQIFALSFGVTVSIGALVLLMSAPQLAHALAAMIARLPESIAEVLPGAAR